MTRFAFRHGLFAGAALLFAASVAATVHGCVAMASMPGMPMPGGWTMSMAWMRMPGQGWLDAGVSFLAMWTTMMVAMMLPVAAPLLWRYRAALGGRDWLLMPMALGYFGVWALWGLVIYPFGSALAALAMRHAALAQAAALLLPMTVVFAGALQFTQWKSRQLAACRCVPESTPTTGAAAVRQGLQLGLNCSRCCLAPTVLLLAVGVMDWRAMLAVTAAIIAERLTPAGERIARLSGAIAIGWGLLLFGGGLI